MNIKLLFVSFLSVLCFMANAEIVHWTIPPHFDSIRVVSDNQHIMADSADYRFLWTYEGNLVHKTNKRMWDVCEQHTVITHPYTAYIYEVCNMQGKTFVGDSAQVLCNYPYFSDGNLLVLHNNVCCFLDTLGKFHCEELKIREARPFRKGLAVAMCYRIDDVDKGKRRNPYYQYINKNYEVVNFKLGNKTIDKTDVSFLSSICDKGFGVAIVDDKVYRYHADSMSFEPFCHISDSINPKRKPFKLESHYNSFSGDTTFFVLNSNHGKALLSIDKNRIPISIFYHNPDTTDSFILQPESIPAENIHIKPYFQNEHYGIISAKGDTLLPPQFIGTKLWFDDYAIMLHRTRKWGLLRVEWDDNFKFRVNDGSPVTFHHRNVKSEVRVDMPLYVSADQTRFEINPRSGLVVDQTSRRYQDTKEGHFTTYKCSINLPSNLPETYTPVSYPVVVDYEGIRSRELTFNVEERYSKYFTVELNQSSLIINDDKISFKFDIDTKTMDLLQIGKISVAVLSDSLQTELDSHSEYNHTVRIEGLQEGVNQIVIQVTEQGCPSADFPFIINYSKPKVTKGKPNEGATVVIKAKEVSQKPKQPELFDMDKF